MAISSAFKSAATQKVAQENEARSTIGSAVTSAAAATFAMSNPTQLAAMGGRITGIGGNVMASTMKEKVDTAKINAEKKVIFSGDEVKSTISTTLSGNPINNAALKNLGTVFETLTKAKEQKIVDEQGRMETSFGKVDASSKLGQQILSKLGGNSDDNDR